MGRRMMRAIVPGTFKMGFSKLSETEHMTNFLRLKNGDYVNVSQIGSVHCGHRKSGDKKYESYTKLTFIDGSCREVEGDFGRAVGSPLTTNMPLVPVHRLVTRCWHFILMTIARRSGSSLRRSLRGGSISTWVFIVQSRLISRLVTRRKACSCQMAG